MIIEVNPENALPTSDSERKSQINGITACFLVLLVGLIRFSYYCFRITLQFAEYRYLNTFNKHLSRQK